MKIVMHRLWSSLLVVAMALPASATTWIVDASNGPGANFTDLPQAIASAAAGDVLLVRAGNYSNFTLSKGLTIIGVSPTRPTVGGFSFTAVAPPVGQTAILAELQFVQLRVTNSPGVVIVDGAKVTSAAFLDHAVDVRLHHFEGGVFATNSTLEAASSTLRGAYFQSAVNGDNGLTLIGSNAIVARTSCTGGWGRDEPIGGFGGPPGSGGDGLRISPAPGVLSTLVLAGGGVSTIQGGGGGYGLVWGDGNDGNGLFNDRSGVWRSGSTYLPGSNTWGGQALVYTPGGGSFDVSTVPDDPTLAIVGTPTAGGTVQLNAYATTGSVVRMVIGRLPTQIATPPVRVQKLVSPDTVIFLGVVPPSGVISYVMPLRPGYSPGTTFYAQAYVADTTAGEGRRTNSVPILVR